MELEQKIARGPSMCIQVVATLLLVIVSCCGAAQGTNVPPALSPLLGIAVPPGLDAIPPTLENSLPDDAYNHLNILTNNITNVLKRQLSFCITNGERERDEVFGFQKNSTFLLDCLNITGGTLSDRICGPGEARLYFKNLATVDTPPPNMNCNSSVWPQACEAGWAASTTDSLDFHSNLVPNRIKDPQPCCAGFFCPRGLSCMIPCPLGSYCPVAALNHTTGLCDPYGYQVTQGETNFSCGGADRWSDVNSAFSIFCPAGQYCPTTVVANNCGSRHFCRLGSTAPEKCSHLTSCRGENLQSQNLQGVGALSLATLTILLLVIYTCSDWLMDIKKRRRSTARELAARQAHEQVSGLQRWRAAKRQATMITRKLGRSLSRRRSRPRSQELQNHSPSITPRANPGSSRFNDTGVTPSSTTTRSGLITETIDEHAPANPPHLAPVPLVPWSGELHSALNPDASDLYQPMPVPPGVSVTLDSPKGYQRPPHIVTPPRDSDSQNFAYAYGQIEKERVFGLNSQSPTLKDLEFLEPYGGMVVRKMRPPIELSFVDLSLILKGNGKKILCNVTGKLTPGRITAVMGPSGAGKTTFLNALAGKATHSYTTGQVFINGKPGLIHSYKRIIGFVPQDDVVHGSLTVEENLWFSASYRLPVDMPKYERVLVVERIIGALGLGPVRDSTVGTVQNRGISGGQRKRVNVGLEMVMEPSLLILDEPTSGLDSTSSRLVLQALRREAMEGVNVGVVLHQPSYGLFQMFDDVMFLAKGGHTVYLGPVNEVESYFSGLGLVVPERINPPDHYMDALEGIVHPANSPDFDPSSLAVLWMMHKGYRIPIDLITTAAEIHASVGKERKSLMTESSKLATSFAQEVWEDFNVFLVVRWDLLKSMFTMVDDMSGRCTPGFWPQFQIILRRVAKQRFRDARLQVQDYIILLMAGACLGFLSNMKDINLGSQGYSFTLIAIALLTMIAALRSFSIDKLQYWRESASGINRIAFFIAKDVVDMFNVVVKPLFYLSMFYFFSNPRSSFLANYTVTLVLVYCVTGIAYVAAILLEPAPAQLWAVFLPIIATLIASSRRSGLLQLLTYLSYARYALEAYVIANAERYTGVWIITRCGLLQTQGYRLHDWGLCLLILFLYGVIARLLALLCLFISNRSRQK